MKLFYAPAACSLASHIAMIEAGLKFDLVKVYLKTKTLSDGTDFTTINSQGYVPALQLKNGEVLTECPAVLQYIADQAPSSNLAPANGSFARYKLQSLLNFLATELHKNFSTLFDPQANSDSQALATQKLNLRFGQLESQLNAASYLMSEYFTIADAYLFTIAGWAKFVHFDLSPYVQLQAYLQRISQRPSVMTALTAEGLLKAGNAS